MQVKRMNAESHPMEASVISSEVVNFLMVFGQSPKDNATNASQGTTYLISLLCH